MSFAHGGVVDLSTINTLFRVIAFLGKHITKRCRLFFPVSQTPCKKYTAVLLHKKRRKPFLSAGSKIEPCVKEQEFTDQIGLQRRDRIGFIFFAELTEKSVDTIAVIGEMLHNTVEIILYRRMFILPFYTVAGCCISKYPEADIYDLFFVFFFDDLLGMFDIVIKQLICTHCRERVAFQVRIGYQQQKQTPHRTAFT